MFAIRSSLFATCLCAVLCGLCGVAPAQAGSAVRVLIDVSGSMRETDPQNLRIPALQLMSELLPRAAEAGVWLFAGETEALVSPAAVDGAWRDTARQALPKIHSRGQFTDIERALAVAQDGWEGAASGGERHLVLLTDGVVDVAKDAALSAASRERILAQQLGELRARGIAVHAVALSDGVDLDLLEALTTGTGGRLERAADAAQLQRSFLRMLEQTAPPVTLPLDDRRFTVDNAVSELSLLVFRDGDAPVSLTNPAGETWREEAHPSSVAWRHAAGYDLITVTTPAAGTWSFEGTDDPDNRAVIVTNLVLELSALPARLETTTRAPLSARMLASGAHVERLDLLELVTASARLVGPGGADRAESMALDRAQARFVGELDAPALEPGDYQLTVTADAGTFQRVVSRRVEVLPPPMTVTYRADPAQPGRVTVVARANAAAVLPATLHGYVTLTGADGEERAVPLPAAVDGESTLGLSAWVSGPLEIAPQLYAEAEPGHVLSFVPPPHRVEVQVPVITESPAVRFSWGHFGAWLLGGNALLGFGLALVWLTLGRDSRAAATGETAV